MSPPFRGGGGGGGSSSSSSNRNNAPNRPNGAGNAADALKQQPAASATNQVTATQQTPPQKSLGQKSGEADKKNGEATAPASQAGRGGGEGKQAQGSAAGASESRSGQQQREAKELESEQAVLRAQLSLLRKPGEKTYTQRCRLFVGNLPADISEDDFKRLFGKYGDPGEVFINKGKGFGFIRL
ncbi:hypothetical protein scyTo_0025012, partial [Scyliorhinus torazame]|nr:hypothetical protein [Scyliorhinus torazame]